MAKQAGDEAIVPANGLERMRKYEASQCRKKKRRCLLGVKKVSKTPPGAINLQQIENVVTDLRSSEYTTFDRHIKKLSRLLHKC